MACKHGNYGYECAACAADRLAALPTPKPAPEYGWVVERGDSETFAPLYWSGHYTWESDNLKAIRFARKEDAAVIAEIETSHSEDDMQHRVCEHGWG